MDTPRIKRLDTHLFGELTRQAIASPRLRDNHNFHPRPEDPVQRLCIALEPDSYVRPHRHPEFNKWEFLVVLQGAVVLLTFDDAGVVEERLEMSAQGELRGVEIPADTFHTLMATKSGTVILEVKTGPYTPVSYTNFADWAPRRETPDAQHFKEWCLTAQPGDTSLLAI